MDNKYVDIVFLCLIPTSKILYSSMFLNTGN